ncbi:MAG: plasmid mobilization protein [bacterium]
MTTHRTRRTTIRLTPRELARIRHNAAATGLPASAYLRAVALDQPIRPRHRYLDRRAIAQTSRVINNLRQLRKLPPDRPADEEVHRELERTHTDLVELLETLLASATPDSPE